MYRSRDELPASRPRVRYGVLALVALLSAVLLAAACAPEAPPPAPEPPAPVDTPAPPTPTVEEPEFADSLVFASASLPDTLDPQGTLSVSGFMQARMFHEALLILDAEAGINPLLASSWEALDDTTWEFHLRDDVVFHNGDPFTAEHVVATVERVLTTEEALHANTKGRLGTIAGAEAIDDHTVQITTSAPDPLFLRRVSMMFISHPSLFDDLDAIDSAPIGTGPFRVVEYVRAQHLYAEAVENHWRQTPYVREVQYVQVPELATLVAGLQAGDIDIGTGLLPEQIEQLEAGGVNTVVSLIADSAVLDLNTVRDTPLRDLNLRLALNYATDRESVLENLLMGAGRLLDGQVVGPDAFGYNPNLEAYPYDPDRARELLDEAGIGQITLQGGGTVAARPYLESAQGFWEPLGITLEIEILDFARYVPLHTGAEPGRPEVWFTGLNHFQVQDADFAMANYVSTSQQQRHNDPEFDAAYEASRLEMDPDRRRELLWEASRILHENPPTIFFNQRAQVLGHRTVVEPFTPRYDTSTPLEEVIKHRE